MYNLISAECRRSSDVVEDKTKSRKRKRESGKDDGIVDDNVAESRGETSDVQQCNYFFLNEMFVFFYLVVINVK